MPRATVPKAEVVRQMWQSSDSLVRQDAMQFDDPVLLKRIAAAYEAVSMQREAMNVVQKHMNTDVAPKSEMSSALFDEAFVTLFVRPEKRIVMIMTGEFLERDDFFDRVQTVLPDFLSHEQRRRTPTPRARWKEIWATEPHSMTVIDKRVAMLIEQALWAMLKRPGRVESADSQDVDLECKLEPWMLKHDRQVMKAQASPKQRRNKRRVQLAEKTTCLDRSPSGDEAGSLEAERCEAKGADDRVRLGLPVAPAVVGAHKTSSIWPPLCVRACGLVPFRPFGSWSTDELVDGHCFRVTVRNTFIHEIACGSFEKRGNRLRARSLSLERGSHGGDLYRYTPAAASSMHDNL